MRKLKVFNNVSIDGYFCDRHGDMSWAHRGADAEWNDWTASNASGDGVLLFGRVTYDLMAGFWPSQQAKQSMPEVAERMNGASKVVFSRTLEKASWQNTKLVKGDLGEAVRELKLKAGPDMILMGSGQVVTQLAAARLIDAYQIVVHPVVLGAGRTLFEGQKQPVDLKLEKSRAFGNGNVVLWYVDPEAR